MSDHQVATWSSGWPRAGLAFSVLLALMFTGVPGAAAGAGTNAALLNEVTAKVLPPKGYQSKIHLGDSMVRLVQRGVIDRGKFEAIYRSRGGLPKELKSVLNEPSARPILITRENARYYVTLLWPLGLANYMSANRKSPINGKTLFRYASTAGWTLGGEPNGGAYFNRFRIVELTAEQEALVEKIARHSYRPCCDNSTFYQDCNHGSALLGLLELGAAQGLTEDELWREALAFNAFWFPQNYVHTALYFKVVKNTDWESVNPGTALGKDFSSGSGWHANVHQELAKLDLLPKQEGGSDC